MSALFAIIGGLGLIALVVTAGGKRWREAVLAVVIVSYIAVFARGVYATLDAICEAIPECIAEPRP